jgi:DNA processing protein
LIAADARAAWAARLSAVPFLNPDKAASLLDALGPDGLERGGDADWAAAGGLELDAAARWRREARAFDADGEFRRLQALGGRLLVRGDLEYPALLKDLPHAPLALYALGRLSAAEGAALVGSRAPTPYGRRMARRFAADLARRGVAVVSGLARGIDAEAHQAALDAGGTTWAVLGSGLGRVYPPDNRDLARRIVAEGGCLLSEYPLATQPREDTFPARNRIIAGLSRAVVVVEGRHKSGARHTAVAAAEYGREVLGVPGPADSPLSELPHQLLRNGARPAVSVDDVLAALPAGAAAPRRKTPRKHRPAVEGDERLVLGVLGAESLSLEELAGLTGLDMTRLSLIMFGLEVKDLVSAAPGQRYGKKSR